MLHFISLKKWKLRIVSNTTLLGLSKLKKDIIRFLILENIKSKNDYASQLSFFINQKILFYTLGKKSKIS